MTKESQSIPLSKVVANLQELCQAQRTGMALVWGSSTSVGRIYLLQGEIVSVSFLGEKGAKALPRLAAVSAARFDFMEDATTPAKETLPPTEKILGYLAGQALQTDSSSSQAASGAVTGTNLTAKARTVLKETLAEHIGPIANVLFEGGLVDRQDLDTAIETLAGKIPNPDHRDEFIQHVRTKLAS